MPLQVGLDESRVHREEDDTIVVAQLPLQSMHQLDNGKLALSIQGERVLLPSHFGIGDPVVLNRRVEEIMHGGSNPDDSARVLGSSGRDDERVEEADEQ